MKKITYIFSVAILGMVLNINAQDLPQPSPAAKVEQRVGLTDVKIEYSRPSAKGRKVFGDLVPFNEMWRTGANKASIITFSDDVTIQGQKIKAGSYSIFTTPTETEWALVLNSKTESWGTGDYDKANDVATIKSKPSTSDFVESMRFTIENVSSNYADVVLSWEKTSVSFRVEVDSEGKAWRNIELAISSAKPDEKWKVLRNSANYCVQTNKNLESAKTWIEESIKLKEAWYSYWVLADVQAALNDKKSAVKSAKQAIKLGEAESKEKGKEFTYKGRLDELIAEWSK